MIHFGPEICHNVEAALQREWLETNGLGGFASSTVISRGVDQRARVTVAAIKALISSNNGLRRFHASAASQKTCGAASDFAALPQ